MATGPANRSGGRAVYAGLILLLAAFVTYAVPIPSDRMTLGTLASIPLALQPGGVRLAIVGNSVVDYRSPCDTDQRTLAQAIGDAVRRPVLDLSYPGQQLAETINYAGVAVQSPGVSDLVILLSTFALDVAPTLDVHSQAFFSLAAGHFYGDDLVPRLLGEQSFTPGLPLQQQTFTYVGRSYPDYAALKQGSFAAEDNFQHCPETAIGMNLPFIEAYYWNQYLRKDFHADYIGDLVRLEQMARARGKRMHIIMLPIDHDDIRTLNPDEERAIANKVERLLAAMHEAGLAPVDMTRALPAGAFSNRWCACGHLQQAGRQAVADRTARDFE